MTPAVSARARALVLPPFDVLNEAAGSLRRRGHHVISLGQAVPGFGPPPAAIEAARRALSDPATHRYSGDAGLLTLREALCAAFVQEHIAAGPDELIVTAGGNQAFMLAAMTLLDPGDDMLLLSPYFVNHAMAIQAVGARAIEVPVSDRTTFRARWPDIAGGLTAKTRAVVLCTPSNPTGAVVRADELARIVGELSSRGIVLVSDETYLHFVYGASHASAASVEEWRRNVVVVGTFSKSFGMTGWRTGYVLAGADFCTQALKIQDAMVICAPVISQIAAEAAVRDNWNYAHSFHGEIQVKRAALEAGLAGIPCLVPSAAEGGFFKFVRVDGCRDSLALAAQILQQVHVVTIPGATFGAAGEGFLRLSYGAATVEELTEAGARLRAFFAAN